MRVRFSSPAQQPGMIRSVDGGRVHPSGRPFETARCTVRAADLESFAASIPEGDLRLRICRRADMSDHLSLQQEALAALSRYFVGDDSLAVTLQRVADLTM